MARWSSPTALYPELWRELVGFDACAWNGVYDKTGATPQTCESWFQYPWQPTTYRAGRDNVGKEVLQAERRLAKRLGFPVAPTYFVDIEIPFPRAAQTITLPHGYVQAIGTEARDTIETGAAVVYDGAPGPYELSTEATVTVAAGDITDLCEVAIYHPDMVSADITDLDETWRIYPIDMNLSGANIEMTFRRCDLVTWEAHESQSDGGLIDIDSASFLTTVDVYRRYTQPGGMVAAWRTCGEECDETTQDLCGIITNERQGFVEFYPATYSGGSWSRNTWSTCALPEKIRVSYLAGWRAKYAQRSCDGFDDLAEVIVKLSLTLLREPVCQCDQFSWLWDSAREKIELATSTQAAVLNFFGSTMLGAVDAYNWWVDHAISEGGGFNRG